MGHQDHEMPKEQSEARVNWEHWEQPLYEGSRASKKDEERMVVS